MEAVLLSKAQPAVNDLVGGIVDMLGPQHHLESFCRTLERLIPSVALDIPKRAAVLFVANRDPSLSAFFESKHPTKWQSFRPRLAAATTQLIDGKLSLVEYVESCRNDWIIA